MVELNIGDNLEWIRGDDVGIIEEISKINDEFYIFKSGNQIYKNIVEEYMTYIGHGIITPTPIEPKQDNVTVNVDLKKEDVENVSVNNAISTILEKSPKTTYNLQNVVLKKLPVSNVINVLYTLFDSKDVNHSMSKLIEQNLISLTQDILNVIKNDNNIEVDKDIIEDDNV